MYVHICINLYVYSHNPCSPHTCSSRTSWVIDSVSVCTSVCGCVCIYIYIYIYTYVYIYVCYRVAKTNRIPYLIDHFAKLATNYRALLRKMTNKDKASYDSTPPRNSDRPRFAHTCSSQTPGEILIDSVFVCVRLCVVVCT